MSWKNVLQWAIIKQIIKENTGIDLNEEIQEKGLVIFEKKHQDDDIYEMEFEDIEDELIDIYIDLLGDGKKRIKNKEVILEIKGLPNNIDPGYLAKWIEENPNFKRYFRKRRDKSDEDDEDSNSSMYI